ncbi:MAG: type II toxin-antitoxin system VapC family toxin, partial [Candidatus Dormibacteraeota bacterium]|nr:type II toxin-antitoxin system VapC family toxin [Candidatus Dormibacteraeota bacterium]
MSSVYFDTSAFVKILVEEPGSVSAVRAWHAADSVVGSRLLPAEARAALAMARRQRRLTDSQHVRAKAALANHWQSMFVVEVTEPVVDEAGELAEQEALRGFDAVHLASARRAAVDVLITADAEMIRAARAHGLKVIDAR